jgi:hypothetical protein
MIRQHSAHLLSPRWVHLGDPPPVRVPSAVPWGPFCRKSQSDAICLEALNELLGTSKGGQVATAHLVRDESKSVAHDPPLELGREEAIVTTEQKPRGDVGPDTQWPRLLEGRGRLLAEVLERRGSQLGR